MEISITLQSYSPSIFPLSQQLQLQPCRPKAPILRPLLRARRLTPAFIAKYGRWDSNAEEMGPNKRFEFDLGDGDGSRSGRKKRRWWSDDSEEDEEEEEVGIVEEVIDSIWILKVFRSYGWALPAILLSLLLATGPKAFLTAMAFPLGQSALTFAYNRVSGKKRTRPKAQTARRKRGRRRKRPSNTSSSPGSDNVEGRGRSWKVKNENSGARTWVDGDESFMGEAGNGGTSSFGGWEELDGVRFREKAGHVDGRSKVNKEMERGKMSGNNEPLLLRLLVAMFPFLGFWTKMFW